VQSLKIKDDSYDRKMLKQLSRCTSANEYEYYLVAFYVSLIVSVWRGPFLYFDSFVDSSASHTIWGQAMAPKNTTEPVGDIITFQNCSLI